MPSRRRKKKPKRKPTPAATSSATETGASSSAATPGSSHSSSTVKAQEASNYVCDTEGPWGQCGPGTADILLHVFERLLWGASKSKEHVTTGSEVTMLLRLGQVCRLWREVSIHPGLWQRIRLSHTAFWQTSNKRGEPRSSEQQTIHAKNALQYLCENRLQHTQQLTLEIGTHLNDSDMQECILKNCTCLNTLSIQMFNVLTCKSLEMVADASLPLLTHLTLQGDNQRITNKASLVHLVTKLCHQLKSLDLSYSVFCKELCPCVAEVLSSCCNLEELVLEDCQGPERCTQHLGFFYLDIERLQAGCPDLQVLALAGSLFKLSELKPETEMLSSGFQDLVEYRSGECSTEALARIVRGAHNLKTLNLKYSTFEKLGHLPCTSLEKVVLPETSFQPRLRVIEEVSQWHSTLTYISMAETGSITTTELLDSNLNVKLSVALGKLLKTNSFHSLRKLDMSSTKVNFTGLKIILKYCPSLEWLNLEDCYYIYDYDTPELQDFMIICEGQSLAQLKCIVLHRCCYKPVSCHYCKGPRSASEQQPCDCNEESEEEYEGEDLDDDDSDDMGWGF